MPRTQTNIHASCIALDGRGVLLLGPSGSGKSDLALRLIDAGARLVADDQSELSRRGDVLVVRAPATIFGLIEARGLGILRLDALGEASVALIAELVPADRIERMPPDPGEERLVLPDVGALVEHIVRIQQLVGQLVNSAAANPQTTGLGMAIDQELEGLKKSLIPGR